ncbi:MAG: DUF6610 family protein [Candidatus Acidiferrum sp.]|jgi:hypothetical protein|nr:DUF6610 family protein [Candidatus Acidoferrum sp.]
MILKFVAHSGRVLRIARRFGWLPGARYTNLRDVREFERIGFLDIEWKDYCFKRHLEAVKATRPMVTVALDIHDPRSLQRILDQASELNLHSERVIIVPKHPSLRNKLDTVIPKRFWLGYSVPTRYGGTTIPPSFFKRPVHLLGGRPDVQRRLAEMMPVVSLDCNRFTLDAAFGDYFDGDKFRPHPAGGYERCIHDSLKHINSIWKNYHVHGTR